MEACWPGETALVRNRKDCPGGVKKARAGDNERRGMPRAKCELRLT